MSFNGDIVVRVVELPPGIHGAIREDPDGIANIYINQCDSQDQQQETLRHELRHYQLHHIGSDGFVEAMEADAG